MQGWVDWNSSVASDAIDGLKEKPSAMRPVLHALQEAFGYIDGEAAPLTADALNASRAEVHGVVTFYHDFRRAPAPRHALKFCRAEVRQCVGGDCLADRAKTRLAMEFGEMGADGRIIGQLNGGKPESLLAEVER